eukprot:TRINITY_DN42819_c0_g1_i2.p1 TRINITY_DN42819_c0_g1~~TRINITY_DN42819_c0_g1_i2.p1  ORF type:complete len:206 (-),score=44.01 TRINITY_DN42819_c0_g1_i2:34-651(-)
MVDQPRVQRTHTDITREINSSPAGILLNTSDLLLLEWMIHVISSAATDGCWAFLLFVQANAIATIWDLGSLVIVCLWGYKCGLEVGNGFLRIAYIALLLWGVFLFLAAAYFDLVCEPVLFYTAIGVWWFSIVKNYIFVPFLLNEDVLAALPRDDPLAQGAAEGQRGLGDRHVGGGVRGAAGAREPLLQAAAAATPEALGPELGTA